MLTDLERQVLLGWAHLVGGDRRYAFRARVVLAAEAGKSNDEIAKELGTWPGTVTRWCSRFAHDRIDGLRDASRPGKPNRYDCTTEARILALVGQAPPAGYAKWNGKLVAEALGDVSAHYVWRVLRHHGISLQRQRIRRMATSSQFAQQTVDLIGLYLNPPENAIVLSVGERPRVQVGDTTQGWCRLPGGEAMRVRHPDASLSLAKLPALLEEAEVTSRNAHHLRARGFLAFMCDVVGEREDVQLHAIIHTPDSQEPDHEIWLARHGNVHFHHLPTYDTWLAQVDIWSSILNRFVDRGANRSFAQSMMQSVQRLSEITLANGFPFEWIKMADKRKDSWPENPASTRGHTAESPEGAVGRPPESLRVTRHPSASNQRTTAIVKS